MKRFLLFTAAFLLSGFSSAYAQVGIDVRIGDPPPRYVYYGEPEVVEYYYVPTRRYSYRPYDYRPHYYYRDWDDRHDRGRGHYKGRGHGHHKH